MSYRIGLAVVATLRSAEAAEIAKSVLTAAGVDCLIRSDTAGGIYPVLGSTELLVRTEDAAKARDALAHAIDTASG